MVERTRKLNLEEHVSSPEIKQHYVTRMFQIIAPRYDFITRFLSYGMDGAWKKTLIGMMGLRGAETVLDVACGTGDITFSIGEQLTVSGMAIGLDITPRMLEIADEKRRERGMNNVSFHRGDIMNLPFPDQSVDFVTGGYALRNVPDVRGGLKEILRVLKPGGRFLSLDFGHPSNRLYDWLYIKYLIVAGSLTGLALHGDADVYRYIPESLKRYPGQRGIKDLMNEVGYVDAGFQEFKGGIMAINYGTKPK